MMTEYELRRIADKATLVRFLVPDDKSFAWTPDYHVPIGELQWYRRPYGKTRWFKLGERFSYDR